MTAEADLIFTGGQVYTVPADRREMVPGGGRRPAGHRRGRPRRPDRRGRQ